MQEEKDPRKFPRLRKDLVISGMVNKHNKSYVVKDPLKNQYFKFSPDEWEIIKLFDGEHTLEGLVERYHEENPGLEIDLETLKDYQDNLDSMNLLQKSQKDMNILLVEKMKEMRQFQLLSKKGSLLYRRFPVVDPDKFFNRIMPYCRWIFSKPFLIFSGFIMLAACLVVLTHMREFNEGMHSLFSFSEMSTVNLITLWVVIYATIALHEVGHGMTCKYFGGDVHEIGFLLLFFQPCLYCNVNDAWLFDKKYKQIMVTIAGGYIEFFLGSLCAFVWVLSSPGTFINTLSFQVMTICSISTVFFNFNPLIKLDGYYLLSDALEVPNLKENSAEYLKWWVSHYIFRMPGERPEGTIRERRIYLAYGIASFFWMFTLLTGLVGMAKGILVDKFHIAGLFITGWIAFKLFKGHVDSSIKFLVNFFIQHKEFFLQPKVKKPLMGVGISLLVLLFLPIHFVIKGKCTLEANTHRVLRASAEGQVKRFFAADGDLISAGDALLEIENPALPIDREIAALNLVKAQRKLRKNIIQDPEKIPEIKKEIQAKSLEYSKKKNLEKDLIVKLPQGVGKKVILSCEDQLQMRGKFLNKGDEICKVMDIEKVRTLVEVSEQQVQFMAEGQEVNFKLFSHPGTTYEGEITKIRPTGKSDPSNPKRKVYLAEIQLSNPGNLRPGMEGLAKIYGHRVSILKYIATKLSSSMRLDLFY